jgi:putative nucleotidyltransferase with HDIG domain
MDLLQDIKQQHADIEVIIITGHGSLESAMEGIRHGAAGYLLKPFNVTELMTLVNQTLEKKRRLDFIRKCFRSSSGLWGSAQEAASSWQMLRTGYFSLHAQSGGGANGSLKALDEFPLLSDILESKDRQLLHHSSRVSFYATLMGTRLNLTTETQHALALGAFLHDIGKTHPACDGSPVDRTLLSNEDMSRTQHPTLGARVITALDLPEEISHIALYHHERWDGQGFPCSLKGDSIPLLARIVSIAQTFDHLTAETPGRSAISVDQALLNIVLESGTHFDPMLADMFSEAMSNCKTSLPPMVSAPLSVPHGVPIFPAGRLIQ